MRCTDLVDRVFQLGFVGNGDQNLAGSGISGLASSGFVGAARFGPHLNLLAKRLSIKVEGLARGRARARAAHVLN